MSYITTHTGRKFYFDKFDVDSVCLEDVAHALSYQCRYNGHGHLFISTAEHSLNIANYIFLKYEGSVGKKKAQAKKLAAQALLHDAAEAYMGDMPGPLKKFCPDFDKLETQLMGDIFEKYGLPRKLYAEVKEADTRILLNEMATIFPKTHPKAELDVKPLEGVVVQCFAPPDIFPMYLKVLKAVFEGYT